MHVAVCYLLLFLSGFVMAIHFSLLMPIDPTFHASWWKFAFTGVIGLIAAFALIFHSK